MAILKYTENEATYASADGRLYGVRYKESYGRNNKPYIKFRIAFDYERTDFDTVENKYLSCCGWNDIAERIAYLSDNNRLRVKVSGKLKQFEYDGEQREQLEVTFVEPLFEIPTGKSKKKDEDTKWGTSESDFTD